MTQYRKKPVVIEAVQIPSDLFVGGIGDVAERMLEIEETIQSELNPKPHTLKWREKSIIISTLEGDMEARPGDWIIRGVKGELYPCKPDIFEATYEAVSAAPSPAEDEVERVARSLLRDEIESYRESDVLLDEHIQWWRDGKDNPESCVHYSTIGKAMRRARAAISAMRPAPKLTEEDRARMKTVAEEIRGYAGHDAPWLAKRADELLSLIDKLTEAG